MSEGVASPAEAPAAELIEDVLSNSYQRRVPGTGDMRHGSEGWHALETSCKVGSMLLPSCCSQSMQLVILSKSQTHPNSHGLLTQSNGVH